MCIVHQEVSLFFVVFLFPTGCVRVSSSPGDGLGGVRLPLTFALSRRAAGRPSGAACAKRGASGRMQRPPEILGPSVRLCESSGKLLHFGKIPKNFGQHLANIQQNSGKICDFFLSIISKKFSRF